MVKGFQVLSGDAPVLRIRPMSQTVNIALHQELVIPLNFVTFRPTATNTPVFSPIDPATLRLQWPHRTLLEPLLWTFVTPEPCAMPARPGPENHTTDAITLQELRRRAPQEEPAVKMVTAPSATQMALLQPQLAAYGNLGTKLNLFA